MLTALLKKLKERICLNKIVSMEDMIPLIKEQIANNGEVSFTPKGNSMLPMLRNNMDTVVLGSAAGKLKKYQVALYLRDNGQYVLHRVVKVKVDYYVMRGDNQFVDEWGIRDDQIIGIVHSFTRKGRTYSCDSKTYIIYYKLWTATTYVRKYIRKCRRLAGKVKRKIIRTIR